MAYKHLKLEDFSRENDRYYVEEPDADFSPEHNYSVIQGTINKYRKMRFGIDRKVVQNSSNVADIISSFAKYKLDKGGGKQLEDWLGRETLATIYGDRLMARIKDLEAIERLNIKKGNTKFKDYYLT